MLHHVTRYLLDLRYCAMEEKNRDKKLEHKSNLEFSSSPVQNPRADHIKTVSRSQTTFNQGILGLVQKIRRLSFQWDQSHI
jgi:hypothetical protein